uniref:Uncharacterized protein n=1 Tax=Physcomitrium patens TaxID=3218 RepID=A0A7I4AII9_PHYPA
CSTQGLYEEGRRQGEAKDKRKGKGKQRKKERQGEAKEKGKARGSKGQKERQGKGKEKGKARKREGKRKGKGGKGRGKGRGGIKFEGPTASGARKEPSPGEGEGGSASSIDRGTPIGSTPLATPRSPSSLTHHPRNREKEKERKGGGEARTGLPSPPANRVPRRLPGNPSLGSRHPDSHDDGPGRAARAQRGAWMSGQLVNAGGRGHIPGLQEGEEGAELSSSPRRTTIREQWYYRWRCVNSRRGSCFGEREMRMSERFGTLCEAAGTEVNRIAFKELRLGNSIGPCIMSLSDYGRDGTKQRRGVRVLKRYERLGFSVRIWRGWITIRASIFMFAAFAIKASVCEHTHGDLVGRVVYESLPRISYKEVHKIRYDEVIVPKLLDFAMDKEVKEVSQPQVFPVREGKMEAGLHCMSPLAQRALCHEPSCDRMQLPATIHSVMAEATNDTGERISRVRSGPFSSSVQPKSANLIRTAPPIGKKVIRGRLEAWRGRFDNVWDDHDSGNSSWHGPTRDNRKSDETRREREDRELRRNDDRDRKEEREQRRSDERSERDEPRRVRSATFGSERVFSSIRGLTAMDDRERD